MIGAGVSVVAGFFFAAIPAFKPVVNWLAKWLDFVPTLLVLGLVVGIPVGFAVHRLRVGMSVNRFEASRRARITP